MKISLVETDAQGGLIHFAYHLAEALGAQGHDTTLITGKNFELAERQGSVSVAPILRLWPQIDDTRVVQRGRAARLRRGLRRIWRGVVLLREWTRLTLNLLRHRPDVAVLSIIRFPILIVFLAVLRLAGIRLVQICHEFEHRDQTQGPFDRLALWLHRAGYRCFETIFFLSKDTRDTFLSTYSYSGDTCILPHPPQLLFQDDPVDLPEIRRVFDIEASDKVVLFFGLLRPSKGVDQLIEAFAQLPPDRSARLVISGYPTAMFDTQALRHIARSLGIETQCRFHFGYLPNEQVASLMRMADLVVFPYRNATASGALALAQSFARPVIATRVGGLAEMVMDGETGLLVQPDDPAALAAAIDDLLRHPDKGAQLARNGVQLLNSERSWGVAAARISAHLEAGAQACRDAVSG